MKTLLITLSMLFIGAMSFSQNKNVTASVEVDGVCMMCKKRIEKTSLKTKGVKSAVWNIDTHELKLFFDENKTSAAQIEANLAAAGHDTKSFEASNKAYEALHPCCKYREAAVIEEHQ
tara:strand:- start:19835 stop:20188 length:354 start_codon:yes stop_codon:yes gene_type:complete